MGKGKVKIGYKHGDVLIEIDGDFVNDLLNNIFDNSSKRNKLMDDTEVIDLNESDFVVDDSYFSNINKKVDIEEDDEDDE